MYTSCLLKSVLSQMQHLQHNFEVNYLFNMKLCEHIPISKQIYQKTNLQTKFIKKCSVSAPKVTTKSISRCLQLSLTSNELHLQLYNFRNYKKSYLGYKRTKYVNIHFASHICIDSCSEMNIGETCSISLPSMWLKVSSTKKRQVVNIFGQKLIW